MNEVARRTLTVFAPILLSGCATPPSTEPVIISNLVQGLMQRDGNGELTVYERGAAFDLFVNGQCVVNGDAGFPCMWYGFEFDYSASSPRTELECRSRTDQPVTLVTPREIHDEVSTERSNSWVLEGREGHEVVAGYALPNGVGRSVHTKHECTHLNETVLMIEFTITERVQ